MKIPIFKEKNWHDIFEVGILIKGIYGFVEVIAGLSLLFINTATLNNIFIALAKSELLEDPKDYFVNYFYLFLQHVSIDTKMFIALYILAHGAVKIFLAITLYKEKLWAYSIAIYFEIAFIAYQGYRLIYNHSPALMIFLLFDIIFLIIVWHEYNYKLNYYKARG
jgi:uncharacterized membrane protein